MIIMTTYDWEIIIFAVGCLIVWISYKSKMKELDKCKFYRCVGRVGDNPHCPCKMKKLGRNNK